MKNVIVERKNIVNGLKEYLSVAKNDLKDAQFEIKYYKKRIELAKKLRTAKQVEKFCRY